jgi:hypothetical protein
MNKLYRLADPACRLPMPDRGGRLFSREGENVDPEHPFYMRLIADGDILPASRDTPEASPPVAPAGRRNSAGLQSEPRPSAGSTKSNAKGS